MTEEEKGEREAYQKREEVGDEEKETTWMEGSDVAERS